MGILSRAWEAVKFFVRMNDKVERLNERSLAQQKSIELLSERVLRLEILLQLSSLPHHNVLELKNDKSPDR